MIRFNDNFNYICIRYFPHHAKGFHYPTIEYSHVSYTKLIQDLKLSLRMNAIKFSQVISCVNIGLNTNLLETISVSIIRVNVRDYQNSLIFTSVSLVDVLFLMAQCEAGGCSQLEWSPLPLQVWYSAT
jgi:hypothetical protein